jgi:hypothetical protein
VCKGSSRLVRIQPFHITADHIALKIGSQGIDITNVPEFGLPSCSEVEGRVYVVNLR